MRQVRKRAAALALALVMGLSPLAAASEALGDDVHTGTVGLAPGSDLIRNIFWSNTYSDLRTERYITYKPGTGVYPVVAYGDKVVNKLTLSAMAKSLEAQGHRVVGGINGDFFDMSTGNTLGVIISNGVLRSTAGGHYAVGFKEDGTAFVGWPGIAVTATFLGHTTQITDVNKTRTAADSKYPGGYYLYTDDYSSTTRHTSAGIDVILSPVTDNLGQSVDVDLPVSGDDGKPAEGDAGTGPDAQSPSDITSSENMEPGSATSVTREVSEVNATLTQSDKLTVGGRVTCTVDQVLESTGAIDIPKGKMVLTINKLNNEWLLSQLASLKPGDRVDIDVSSADTRWNEAVTAIGAFYKIVNNGQIGPDTDKTANPRTAIGVKADGTVVLYAVDGKQSGYSVGATLAQVAQRMIELGCVDAVGMDGGGSTMIGATMPGNSAMELLSRPSDGQERAVSTGFFLVSDLKPTGTPDHLFVTPYDAMLLAGASVPLQASAMDTSYYPTTTSSNITWSIHNGDGLVTEGGVFTAGAGKGTTQVTAAAGQITGTSTMTVVSKPDSITVTNEKTGNKVTSLSVDPMQAVDLTASSVYRKLPLISQDNCYTWSADPTAGTFDENGTFTAAGKSGVGNIFVSAGGTSVTIPVTIAGHIQALETFEGSFTSLIGTETVTVTPETSLDSVRFGKQSARVEYDTGANGSAIAGLTLTIPAGERYMSLWVYGDNSGNSLTATAADAQGKTSDVVLTGLDFTGWKQLTVALPEGTTAIQSLSVVYGGQEGKEKGKLWLDQITTSNEEFVDNTAPTVSLTVSGTALTAVISDNVDRKFDASAISVKVDGDVLKFSWDAEKGSLKAVLPAADTQLHRITVTATDQSGNIGSSSADIQPLPVGTDPDAPVEAPGPFADMTGHWAKPYTNYLYSAGISNGVKTSSGLQFQPQKNITRGEFALMVARWMGLDLTSYSKVELPFADVKSIPAWSLDGIKAMYSLGIMKGSLDNGVLVSRASATISRAEAMTILGRIQPKGYPQPALTFLDAADVAEWALPHVQSLAGQGVISGFENKILPNEFVKRGEVAKMLYALQ